MDEEKLKESLALALIYLSAWDEVGVPGTSMRRAWKGYDFEILDKLKEASLIDFSFTAKSLYLTEDGERAGGDIVKKMLKKLGPE